MARSDRRGLPGSRAGRTWPGPGWPSPPPSDGVRPACPSSVSRRRCRPGVTRPAIPWCSPRWRPQPSSPVGTALHAAWPFDVIHAHTGLPDGLAAATLADAVRVPLLTTEHDSSTPGRLADPAAAAAYRGLIGPGRGLVAVSLALAGRIEERLGPDAGPIEAVPNVLPVATFQMRPGRGAGSARAALGRVAQGEQGHGHAPARLRACSTESGRRSGSGSSAARPPGQRRSASSRSPGSWASRDAVRFEPPTDRAGVAAAMARAALFVHPSPWETFGVVAAEALAMGLPVVATPSGGVEEILGE